MHLLFSFIWSGRDFLMNSMKLSALMPKRMPDSAERSVS